MKRIEEQATAQDFWNDQEAAQSLMAERSRLERTITRQEQFESSVEDAGVLFEFVEESEDSLPELRALIERLAHDIGQAETEMLLAGENDS